MSIERSLIKPDTCKEIKVKLERKEPTETVKQEKDEEKNE